MQEWTALVAAGVLALVAAGLGVALLRLRARTDAALTQARAETEELRRRVDELARPAAPERPSTAAPAQEFVITRMGEDDDPATEALPAVPAPVFVDLVVRESAVRAGALVAGLRRALAPETRNRIRFEMRREVKRARRQRKADTRAALRAWRARQRGALGADERGSAA